MNQSPSRDEHNHDNCIERALENAAAICNARGLRWTANRRRILELVWASHQPIGAYEILETLKAEVGKAAPPTVYRALEFLIDARLVHRLDSLNAYIGCPDPHYPHTGQFLICDQCRSVTELDDKEITAQITASAAARGFSVQHQTLEIQGLCGACEKA